MKPVSGGLFIVRNLYRYLRRDTPPLTFSANWQTGKHLFGDAFA